MDPGVDSDRAGVLHVPPRCDRDAIATADVRFKHQARLAYRSVANECLRQPVDRIAAVVFGNRNDAPGATGCCCDGVTRSNRQRQGFFAQQVQPGLQTGNGHLVVRGDVRSDRSRLEV